MPRAKTPKHHLRFEIVCEGIGRTRDIAIHNHDQEFKYINRWIQGRFHSSEVEIDSLGLNDKYVYQTRLVFIPYYGPGAKDEQQETE